MAFDMSDYNTVPERLIEFRDKYPEGSLRPADPSKPFTILEVNGKTFLAYTAAAYRTPDDLAPGIGCAWEPVPGLTNYTKNSELQNAETSAWGRAIIAVGAADAKKGIASAEDVRNRRQEQENPLPVYEDPTIPGLRTSIEGWIAKLDDGQRADLKAWLEAQDLPAVQRMNARQADVVLEHLIDIMHEVPT